MGRLATRFLAGAYPCLMDGLEGGEVPESQLEPFSGLFCLRPTAQETQHIWSLIVVHCRNL